MLRKSVSFAIDSNVFSFFNEDYHRQAICLILGYVSRFSYFGNQVETFISLRSINFVFNPFPLREIRSTILQFVLALLMNATSRCKKIFWEMHCWWRIFSFAFLQKIFYNMDLIFNCAVCVLHCIAKKDFCALWCIRFFKSRISFENDKHINASGCQMVSHLH